MREEREVVGGGRGDQGRRERWEEVGGGGRGGERGRRELIWLS